jgi:hypothetical protein
MSCQYRFKTLEDDSLPSLTDQIRKVAHNINKFKYELRKFLMENSFYSIEEYIDRNNKIDPVLSH